MGPESPSPGSSAISGRNARRLLKPYHAPQYKIVTAERAEVELRAQSITWRRTRALEQVGVEIDRNAVMCGATDFSLTLYAARELERYLCGEKTQICNRRLAEVYYHVLCAGIEQLPRLDRNRSE